MTRIAAVHTVPSVYASFPALIREAIPGADVANTVDEFLASDPAVKGEFTVDNLNRLYAILRCAEMTEPDAIVVTCSTLTPPVETLRPLITTPLVTIDGLMHKKAVGIGSKITLLATAQSTIEPGRVGLAAAAEKIGKQLDIETIVCDEAYIAIKKLDQETHDREVLAAAEKIKNRDVIVLAQASMAHLQNEIQKRTGIATLSSPALCMEDLKKAVGK